jgi:hypothetical protein
MRPRWCLDRSYSPSIARQSQRSKGKTLKAKASTSSATNWRTSTKEEKGSEVSIDTSNRFAPVGIPGSGAMRWEIVAAAPAAGNISVEHYYYDAMSRLSSTYREEMA